jgi:hypothetical protein
LQFVSELLKTPVDIPQQSYRFGHQLFLAAVAPPGHLIVQELLDVGRQVESGHGEFSP